MWTRKLLKENGKTAFKRNYWVCVAVCVIAMLLGGITGGNGISLGNNDSIDLENSFGSFQEDMLDDMLGDMQGGMPGNMPGGMPGGAPGNIPGQMPDGFSLRTLGGILRSLLVNIPPFVISVIVAVLLVAVTLGITISILVSNVVAVGCNRYFIENREHKTGVGQLFYSFREGRYGSTVLIMFFKGLYTFLWSLLFVIPGIIKNYAYALVPYILAENTNLDKSRVLSMSKEMMKGHKWELFVLELSFLGWNILGVLTAGILNIFYVNPYIQATRAEFYSAVKAEAIQNGIVLAGELPGVSIPTDVPADFVEVV